MCSTFHGKLSKLFQSPAIDPGHLVAISIGDTLITTLAVGKLLLEASEQNPNDEFLGAREHGHLRGLPRPRVQVITYDTKGELVEFALRSRRTGAILLKSKCSAPLTGRDVLRFYRIYRCDRQQMWHDPTSDVDRIARLHEPLDLGVRLPVAPEAIARATNTDAYAHSEAPSDGTHWSLIPDPGKVTENNDLPKDGLDSVS